MAAPDSIWNPRGKIFAHQSIEKSALIVFVEFCSEMSITCGEMRAILPAAHHRSSIFHLTGRASERLAQAIGIEPALWDQARGADLLAGRHGLKVLVPEIRYCRTCLERGNHSALFQLPQIARCPLHDAPLQIGCPHCGRYMSTNPSSLARNHLYCGSCNRNLATLRRRMTLGEADVYPAASSFAELRNAAARNLEPGESRSPVQWDVVPVHTASTPALARMLYAQTIWLDSRSTTGLEGWKLASFNLPAVGLTIEAREVFFQTRVAAIQAMQDLATQLKSLQVDLGHMSFSLDWGTRSAGRRDFEMSMLSAAFWQTAMVFDVHRFLDGQTPPPVARGPYFADWIPRHVDAITKVIQQAVLELFTFYVIANRRLKFGVQLAWSRAPPKASYLVPWRLRVASPATVDLQIRFRVTNGTFRRLVSRYKDQRLFAVPADADPLEVINRQPV
jgi:hypothetical protein